MHVRGPDAAIGIGENLSFTAVNPFAAIQAPVLEDAWSQLHTLTVDAGERRQRLAPVLQPVQPGEHVVDLLPEPGFLPAVKIVETAVQTRETSSVSFATALPCGKYRARR